MSEHRKQVGRVVAYVKPSYKKLVDNYASVNEISRSEAVEIAVKNMFDKMPAQEKAKYLECNKPVRE